MTNVRNILLIGNVGKGKSALANVLTETSEFEESADRINGSDKAKSKEFEHKEIKYRVIDTVGTEAFIKQTEVVLGKLENKADILSEGLNQILFVTNGRFTKEEAEAFDLLRNAIFDDHATDYTTIVCTNFPNFRDKSACKKNRQEFQKEIEEFSNPLASTAIIYVDNPPPKARYKLMAESSRRASRKILLNHLKTCQEVYRPKLLGKFCEMIDEFNSIIEDTVKAIKNADLHFNFVREFIFNIVGKIEEENYQSMMLFQVAEIILFFSASGSIIKEKKAKLLKEGLEKCKMLENLQEKLSESISKFEEIRPRFECSEYKKQNINREKIEIIENVMNQILENKIETDMKLEENKKTEHSTAAKTIVETICKLVPSLSCMYRLKDTETTIKKELEALKDKRHLLSKLCEKINQCKEGIEKL